MQAYLAPSRVVDFIHPAVAALARELGQGAADQEERVRRCFEFVRDQVLHSVDGGIRSPVTCLASEVLAQRTGLCYAKSHLLAALLRALGVPTGFCYQRLRLDGPDSPCCLHGLNAVWLEAHGWYRIDARGNKPGVAARFCPPREQLAFLPSLPGEQDLPGILTEPLPQVVAALEGASDLPSLLLQLPDWDGRAAAGDPACIA